MGTRVPAIAFGAALGIVAATPSPAEDARVPLLRHQVEISRPETVSSSAVRQQPAPAAAQTAPARPKSRTVAEMVGRLFEKKRPPAVQPLPASVAASVPRRVAAKPTPILPEPKIAEETAWPTDGELPAALALVERYNRSARPASSDPAARRVDTAFSALASFAAVEGPDDSRFMPESIPDMLAYSVDTPEVQPAEPGLIAAPAPSAPRPAASDLERLIDRYAAANGVPVDLARALVFVQSTNNPKATGAGGEIGLMQLQVSAAREMGFQGEAAELYDAETNLAWGMKYLGKAQALGNGETCETLLRYSAGHFATRMGEATLKFCGKVQTAMAERSKVPAGL